MGSSLSRPFARTTNLSKEADALKKDNKTGVFRFLRFLPLAVIALCIVVFWKQMMSITPEELASHVSGNPIAAIIFVFVGYTLESLSVVFPVVIMQLAVSLLFPVWAALPLNAAGLLLAANLGYFIGKFTGEDFAKKFAQKYGRSDALMDIDPERTFHFAFLLRAISVLPMDAVSMVFGSMNVPYLPYLIGTLAGTIPSMVAVTVAGASATDPGSPAFIISASITVLLSVGSIILNRIRDKRTEKAKKDAKEKAEV